MSKRKAAGGGAGRVIGVILLLALVAGGGWYVLHARRGAGVPAPTTHAPTPAAAPVAADAQRIDAANEGHELRVEGTLHAGQRVRDAELGVEADALVLVRRVEMRQWQERCTGSDCDYALVWAEQPIDSHAFRVAKGHENPATLPFASKRFVSADVRLGAFRVEHALAVDALASAAGEAFPVRIAQLPPNLAATLHEQGGLLYTGDAPDRAAAGDLRIGYRAVAQAPARIDGVQSGKTLKSAAAH